MTTTRMTGAMKRSLEVRIEDLEARIATLDAQRKGDDSVEATALLMQLKRERGQIDDALRDAMLIDDEPFDVDAIEIGDAVTILDDEGQTDRYVLVDDGVGSRVRSDWMSVSSPLGAAILGRSTGDRVEVDSPQGPMSCVILGFERASETSSRRGAAHQAAGRVRLPSEAFLG